MQCKKVVCLTDLRGSMTFESQSSISLRHSTSIIYHLNRRSSGINYQHPNRLGTSINSILNQLLNHRSRALDDLTSSNLVGHTIGSDAVGASGATLSMFVTV